MFYDNLYLSTKYFNKRNFKDLQYSAYLNKLRVAERGIRGTYCPRASKTNVFNFKNGFYQVCKSMSENSK